MDTVNIARLLSLSTGTCTRLGSMTAVLVTWAETNAWRDNTVMKKHGGIRWTLTVNNWERLGVIMAVLASLRMSTTSNTSGLLQNWLL